MEILEGYREPHAPAMSRCWALDPGHVDRRWRERIGIVLQDSEMHPELTVRESLALFAGYYRQPRGVDAVISLVDLTDKADDRVARLSGGQKRRLGRVSWHWR